MPCDCMECMVDGTGIDEDDSIKLQRYHNVCQKNNKRTGLDAFFDE